MNTPPLSRRDFVKNSAVAAAALQLPAVLAAATASAAATSSTADAGNAVDLHWLEGGTPAVLPGTTWGMPWPRGRLPKDAAFAVRTAAGEPVPVQSWPLATWPDGSLKWSGHALAAATGGAERLQIAPGTPAAPSKTVTVSETPGAFTIDTGVITCHVARSGPGIIESITRDGREIARDGRLVCLRQDRSDFAAQGILRQETFTGAITTAVVEQSGPVRAVVRLEGKHEGPGGRAWLPFIVRLYFHAGGDAVRVAHTFIFDGEQSQDFIQGLGVRFAVPLHDELHNRHVRFVGEGSGVWGESVHNLPGWAGRFGFAYADLFPEQLDGKSVLPLAEFDAKSRAQFETVAVWNDFTLFQSSADHFDVRKRTKANSSWVKSGHGRRSSGLVYLGGVSGGLALGRRHFWEMHPTQIDVTDAATDVAGLTLWLWSPDAPPMDLRHYSDHAQGLEINYEDWEEGHSTPLGVSRTNELILWALPATPPRTRLVELAAAMRSPPQIVCPPAHYHGAGVFGRWSLPNRSTPGRARLEDELLRVVAFYQKEVEQQQWYGFWHYGDIMHTYDAHRHTWRYDVGGYAWANSEMVPDMWLWYSFLRSGRADIFRMAEAMTRHTSEVDMYKLGPFAPLGSRHNVNHWGCGAKEARISMAGLKRFYYYLTADERVGDLMRMTVNADFKTVDIDPLRKLGLPPNPYPTHARSGPDWFAFASNWMTEWERTGDTKWRDKIVAGMDSLAAMPNGMLSGPNFAYDPASGKLFDIHDIEKANWLMMGVFGGSETAFELQQLIDHPAWDRAWLQCCELWNDTEEAREKVTGRKFATGIYPVWYSRFTAYAAFRRGDAALAARAWKEFLHGINRIDIRRMPIAPQRVESPAVLNPIDELPWLETNHASQWSLNLIENLELIGDHLPPLDGPWLET
jgi:hypothetical protein